MGIIKRTNKLNKFHQENDGNTLYYIVVRYVTKSFYNTSFFIEIEYGEDDLNVLNKENFILNTDNINETYFGYNYSSLDLNEVKKIEKTLLKKIQEKIKKKISNNLNDIERLQQENKDLLNGLNALTFRKEKINKILNNI